MRVLENLLLIHLEIRLQRLVKSHRFAGDHVHQRSTLDAGENRGIDLLFMLRLHQNNAAARTTQTLVGGGGHHISMWHRIRINTARDQPGVVRHIDHEISTDILGYFREALKINFERISRCTGQNQLWFGLMRQTFHLVVIDFLFCIQAVRDRLEPFARHIEGHAVCQVSAFSQTHAEERIAGIQQGKKHRLIRLRAAIGLDIGGFGTE